GEGAEFAVEDRRLALEGVLAAGILPSQLIVSVGALALPDVAALAAHATAQGVAGVLLMPPCLFRNGIGEDGIFRFYAAVIGRAAPSSPRSRPSLPTRPTSRPGAAWCHRWRSCRPPRSSASSRISGS